ncbi:ABC transporter permease [Limobrevibacterium gyesilva]|uniref:ABC transporter permease subunit n=1 Tax=Limobrevibacterium gyesilva TaxID=2991712 RepID=A0AA42CD41_9PROT|nr:ABC transporter permease subunit [Limobrevibacterium gyesilva]MCW3473209.1 ABC transporter permease subunit [Limobrevibacterium gyesilva]
MKVGRFTAVLAACGYGFLLSPLLLVCLLSFSADDYLTFPPSGWSLRWFGALVANGAMLQAARTSLLLASVVTLLALAAGLPAALAVARGWVPGAVAALLSAPLLLPTLVLGLALLMALQPLALVATWPGLALAHIVVVLPFVVRIMTTALSALPAELEAAAATLGASPLRVFWRVTLPLAAPGAIAAATLAFLVSFDEVVISLFLVGPRLTTLSVALFRYTESRTDPLVAALAVALIAVTVVVVLTVDRLVGFTRTIGRT